MPQTNCPNTKANNTPFQGLLKSAAAKKKKRKKPTNLFPVFSKI